ncbi:MAG: hypothetical protein Q9212_006968 [Teloschistes hypoglaucus]
MASSSDLPEDYAGLLAKPKEITLNTDREKAQRDRDNEALRRQNAEKERLLQEKDHLLQEKDHLLQNTTLSELLQTCHNELFEQMRVQDKPELTTRGTTTKVTGKPHPDYLRPWDDFPKIQDIMREQIREAVESPSRGALRIFPSIKGIKDQGEMVNGVSHALQDGAAEVEEERQKSSKKKMPKVPPPANVDQLVVTQIGNDTYLTYILEYKAPHKLTEEFLETALSGDLDVREIIQRIDISPYSDEKFAEDAKRLVAAVATQTYAYMLQGGLAYGCIITGEAMVFLHIEESDPTTLYYHLATPLSQVAPDDASTPEYPLTAVSQLLSFSLLAARTPNYSKDWRNKATNEAKRWKLDYVKLEQELETPRSQRKMTPKPSTFKGRKGNFQKKYQTRAKKDDDTTYDDHNSESSDDPLGADTPSRQPNTRSNKVGHQTSRREAPTKNSQQQRKYCTQACLLGLVHQSAIDEGCPNAALHPRRSSHPNHHLIGARKLRGLITEQLATTLDKNCINLNINGARGMLFQITLESHGYTFVAKGTIDVFVSDLKHEGKVYNRLRSLQGKCIPVYLGNIDLVSKKWYEYGICILHMLLMSYGGANNKHKG